MIDPTTFRLGIGAIVFGLVALVVAIRGALEALAVERRHEDISGNFSTEGL